LEVAFMRRENQSFPDVPSVAMALTPSYPVYCVRPAVLQENARRFVTHFGRP
jgi:ornithine decarboxylase